MMTTAPRRSSAQRLPALDLRRRATSRATPAAKRADVPVDEAACGVSDTSAELDGEATREPHPVGAEHEG